MYTRMTPRGTSVALATLALCTANITLLVGAAPPTAGIVYESDVLSAEAAASAAAAPAAPLSSAQTTPPKGGIDIPSLPAGSFELVENGYRRIHGSESVSLTPDQVAERIAAGKAGDLVGHNRIVQTFTDYLPADWLAAGDLAPGARVDSFGNPIVNSTPALPDWAQRDVDGLRNDLADRLLHLHNLDLALAGQQHLIAQLPPNLNADTYLRGEDDLLTDRLETEHVIGNFAGQAIVRSIDVADIIAIGQSFSDAQVVSLASFLHHYEGLKAAEATRLGQAYQPSAHPAYVTALLESRGWSMHDVLALENLATADGAGEEDEGGIAGGIPLSCIFRTPFAVGMTNLSAPTTIWSGSAGGAPYDDEFADVPIGFRHYFYACADPDQNTSVRVSTNGYISFFQQGGGALDGTDFSNDPLPNTNDPDGIAAPWWDDLIVTNQGGTDSVSYKTEGSVGFRVFTVQWSSISRLGGSSSDFHWFQVKLFENYTHVQLIYDTLWAPDTSDNATSGIENYLASTAHCGLNCGNTNAVDPNSNFDFAYIAAPNNLCSNAECIEEGEVVTASTFGADGTDITSCASNDFADVWFRYTASASETCTVNLCSSDYDTTVAVFSSCGGAQISCDDDGCAGTRSTTTFNTVAGNTYLIRVSGWNGSRGFYTISINGGGSTGDVCQTCHSTATNGFFGNTNNNSGCDDDTPCALNDTIDEWFCYTAPANGTAFAHTCDSETDFDTTLAVFAACGQSGSSAIACNDDWFGCTGGGLKSRVQWNVHSGVTYRIRLAGYQGDTGNYVLHTGLSDCPADIAPIPTGDGEVDVDDLVAVILAWGPCSGCRPDFTPPGGNGQVNVDDLVSVILNWGVCP